MTPNEKQRAELDALDRLPEAEIDFSDIPETLDWSEGIRRASRAALSAPHDDPPPTDPD